jgi:hypothetical protein
MSSKQSGGKTSSRSQEHAICTIPRNVYTGEHRTSRANRHPRSLLAEPEAAPPLLTRGIDCVEVIYDYDMGLFRHPRGLCPPAEAYSNGECEEFNPAPLRSSTSISPRRTDSSSSAPQLLRANTTGQDSQVHGSGKQRIPISMPASFKRIPTRRSQSSSLRDGYDLREQVRARRREEPRMRDTVEVELDEEDLLREMDDQEREYDCHWV